MNPALSSLQNFSLMGFAPFVLTQHYAEGWIHGEIFCAVLLFFTLHKHPFLNN